MASFSVSSVLFSASAERHYKETKQGTYVYKGDGLNYYEWEFRTELRVANKTGEHCTDAVSNIVNGIRGDAFVVAQEVGLESLFEPDGVDTLTRMMREMVFPPDDAGGEGTFQAIHEAELTFVLPSRSSKSGALHSESSWRSPISPRSG